MNQSSTAGAVTHLQGCLHAMTLTNAAAGAAGRSLAHGALGDANHVVDGRQRQGFQVCCVWHRHLRHIPQDIPERRSASTTASVGCRHQGTIGELSGNSMQWTTRRRLPMYCTKHRFIKALSSTAAAGSGELRCVQAPCVTPAGVQCGDGMQTTARPRKRPGAVGPAPGGRSTRSPAGPDHAKDVWAGRP